jgi:hypothetical protein
MRKSKHSADEIEAAERAADDRKHSRGNGFDMMSVRDRGWGRLPNGTVMEWWVEPGKRRDGIAYSNVPQGMFLLHTEKQDIMFDADDFRKLLRWV